MPSSSEKNSSPTYSNEVMLSYYNCKLHICTQPDVVVYFVIVCVQTFIFHAAAAHFLRFIQ